MANFKIAIDPVLAIEGGWVRDPNDNGGETYRGVARKFWPNWKGWTIVDQYKTFPNFPANLKGLVDLNQLVIDFYDVNFWDKIGGDNIKNQSIADLLVDSAVNEGISAAVKRAENIVGLPKTGIISLLLINKLNSLA
jgi:lysozyme family protein